MVVGAVGMRLSDSHSMKPVLDLWLLQSLTDPIVRDLNTLRALRNGRIDPLLDATEWDLSLYIREFYEAFPDAALSDSSSVKILEKAARYRSEYPYKTGDAEKDRIVEEVLARASKRSDAAGSAAKDASQ